MTVPALSGAAPISEPAALDISGWIAHWAQWTPGKTALRFEGRCISYAELARAVQRAAAWLGASGVSSGDRVAYLGPNCPELLELLFACARTGAIFVPLNARMPAAELRVFLAATRPRLVVAADGFREVALASAGEDGHDRVVTFAGAAGRKGFADGAERVRADPEADLAAPVLILFTSGTTGRPKGATFTQESMTFNALNVITAFGLTAADEILTAVPMFHSGGLFIHTTPGLCAGATVTIHREFNPGLLLEDVQRYRVTLLACVPAMTFALAAHPAWHQADLSSLRSVLTGSTFVPRAAVEPWQRRGVAVLQGYGSTETCPVVTSLPAGSPGDKALTAGKPVLYHRVRIVDGAGRDVAAGEPGEVWIRGRSVMQGYWENPQATREAFRDGWFRNGDLGLFDEQGFLHIVGRIKDIIIVGSSNVYPGDLETVLSECAGICEAAVVGRRDDELGEVPVACVVRVPGRSLTREQVIALFDGRLATYKHPRDVIFLDALPRTATGKVQKTVLRDLVTRPIPSQVG
ncbi:MAG TPA: AMP-binding protein [Streptosporangiaceae bacterium]|nr:AMP-binding protein [Streptosporangiaceae bacterium]